MPKGRGFRSLIYSMKAEIKSDGIPVETIDFFFNPLYDESVVYQKAIDFLMGELKFCTENGKYSSRLNCSQEILPISLTGDLELQAY